MPLSFGIGLLAFGLLAVGALYLADLRSSDVATGGLADAEVPAIFGEAINGESWNGGGYQLVKGNQPEIHSNLADPVPPMTGMDPAYHVSSAGQKASGVALNKLRPQVAAHEGQVAGQQDVSSSRFGL